MFRQLTSAFPILASVPFSNFENVFRAGWPPLLKEEAEEILAYK
jgi:hypothetical protein